MYDFLDLKVINKVKATKESYFKDFIIYTKSYMIFNFKFI